MSDDVIPGRGHRPRTSSPPRPRREPGADGRRPAAADRGRPARYPAILATEAWKGTGGTSDPTSGDWSTASNWSGGSVPAVGDDPVLGGTSGSGYVVTLDTNSAALDSLNFSFSNGGAASILAIGSNTLNVNGTASGATDTLTLSGDNIITIQGGTLNAGTLSLASSNGLVLGYGSLDITGNTTGTGTIEARAAR
jgi:hypothetical protein